MSARVLNRLGFILMAILGTIMYRTQQQMSFFRDIWKAELIQEENENSISLVTETTSDIKPANPSDNTPSSTNFLDDTPVNPLYDEYFLRIERGVGARYACALLDSTAQLDLKGSAKVFVDCMDSLEVAQREASKVLASESCTDTPELIHSLWSGSLPQTAQLGLISFVMAYPPGCVRIKLWVTAAEEARKNIESLLPRRVLDAVDFVTLDFGLLCDHIIRLHPSLEPTLKESRFNLQKISNKQDGLVAFSNVVRMFSLAAYGGVWLDIDMLLLRPMTPILSRDWIYRWSYTDYSNTAAMHMRLGSPNAAAAIKMGLDVSGNGDNLDKMTAVLRPKKFHSLIATLSDNTIDMLPSAYFDPLWIPVDIKFKEANKASIERYGLCEWNKFFSENNTNPKVNQNSTANFFPGIFAFHWHNQWKSEFKKGSTAALLWRDFHYAMGVSPVNEDEANNTSTSTTSSQ